MDVVRLGNGNITINMVELFFYKIKPTTKAFPKVLFLKKKKKKVLKKKPINGNHPNDTSGWVEGKKTGSS